VRPRGRLRPAPLAIAALAIVLAAHSAATVVARSGAQADWRAPALASFDEAWSTINDTFHDPAFGGVDWAAVRTELRPKAERAATADDVRGVIREMLARLGRSHFALLSADSAADTLPGEAGVSFEVRIGHGGALVTRTHAEPAAPGAARPGDVILAIDGWLVPGSPPPAGGDARAHQLDQWRAVNRALHGDAGSIATLRVRGPDGRERDVQVTRAIASGQVVNFGNLQRLRVRADSREVRTPAGRRAGLIAFNLWMPAINGPLASAIDTFRDADGLVIDLRGNPGGLADMIRGVAGYLFPETVLLGRMRTRATEKPLEFKANPRRSTPDGRTVEPFSGPVAILVDEMTASTSECFTGALQSLGRARVFGRQTMGQALPALTKRLPNGDALMYAIGDFETPSGAALEGAGVIPDQRVALSPEALAAGRDPDLEAALAWIDTAGRR
jgi:carboxyl-terminal processing protease